ncbi:arginase family protein [Stenotrophomonas sp. SMYL11]|uniref:arginase family protein n=1 Tax=Stenotrophomonas sp. SMYL11 TaxID=3076042 RepID=UPI002E7A6A3B|nr:arginase family protein [Stenotrophomonas sp. SMYL11]
MVQTGKHSADTTLGIHQPLRLSRFLQLEALSERDATLFLSHDGARVRIPKALYALLMRFEQPQRVDTVVTGHSQAEKLAEALLNLARKGFLHDAGMEQAGRERCVTDPPQRMFDSPAFKPDMTRVKMVVIGVPSDHADPRCAGGRAAPMALRELSLHLLHTINRRTGGGHGWYDADELRPLLRGVCLADAGDVFVDPGESQHAVFRRMAQVLAGFGDALPIVVGGDSTACWPVLTRYASQEPVCLLRIGGPAQRGPAQDGVVSAATLLARAISLDGVAGTLQVAATGGPGPWKHPDHRYMDASVLRAGNYDQTLHEWLAGKPVHLGLNLDALDAPGEPLADERLRYQEVVDFIACIGAQCRIVSIDITGMTPMRPGWNVVAPTALHLLVLAMDAAHRRAAQGVEQHDA